MAGLYEWIRQGCPQAVAFGACVFAVLLLGFCLFRIGAAFADGRRVAGRRESVESSP